MPQPSSNTNKNNVNRESLTQGLEQRYSKSKIKEVGAPIAVNGIPDKYARGFVMNKNKQALLTDFTGEESSFVKGLDNRKYRG
jgi:hypothetical protein